MLGAALASCGERKAAVNASRKQHLIDSLFGLKKEELYRQAMEDLDRRKSIEIKAKADSIVYSMSPQAVKDSAAMPDNTIPNNLPQP